MSDNTSTEAELEKFRQQWKEEVSTRGKGASASTIVSQPSSDATTTRKKLSVTSKAPKASGKQPERLDDLSGPTFHDLPDKEENLKLGAAEKGLVRPSGSIEPVTALEHYEKAVENESAGKLGDSLKLYRQAFRLDDNVHEKYKNKHFPPSAFKSKPANTNASTSSSTVANPAHQPLSGLPPTINELVESFSSLSIPGAAPPTDASPVPPCPISELPQEIISQILYHVGRANVGAFSRVALVCKNFAYLAMTEEQIWKAIVLSSDQGFGAMHYNFATDVYGKRLPDKTSHVLGIPDIPSQEDETLLVLAEPNPPPSLLDISTHLLNAVYASSWRQMYRNRPRIRFHGVYISTVNYTRPGGASPTINTWLTPVHIVTYYRYLRFYRDGTCISLLTTAEPVDVVHIISKEHLVEHTSSDPRQQNRRIAAPQSKAPTTTLDKSGSSHGAQRSGGDHQQQGQQQQQHHTPALPASQIMKDALRGRWRLSGPGDGVFPPPPADAGPDHVHEAEGDLHVETEGVVPRYTYKMQFAIGQGSAGAGANAVAGAKRGSRGLRLAWKGFWSYNRLTDDWGEFGLRNDRAFYFSRVKSYGAGG